MIFVYRLTEPIDIFDGLTPLPDWLNDASPHATQWALQAVLALADAAPDIGWQGDMRHLPSVGVIPDPPAVTAYLIVKQDDNGTTFVVTASNAAWLDNHAAACSHVAPRPIGRLDPPDLRRHPRTMTLPATLLPSHLPDAGSVTARP